MTQSSTAGEFLSKDREEEYLKPNEIYLGDARDLLPKIRPNSVALSVWSPPYFVGKSYEKDMSFDDWKNLLGTVIAEHYPIIAPGGFLVVNIADILCFKDRIMPRIMANSVSGKKRGDITRELVLKAMKEHPDYNRYRIAELLECSEQTVQRRLEGVNIRGGKYNPQTKVKLVGGFIEEWGEKAGFYLYDRRVWAKDPAWQNSKWHTLSYRSVDEFEYIYIFWKPGETKVDRRRLTRDEWREWGSRGVWHIPSVRANIDHESMFPLELAKRVIRLLSERGDLILDPFVGSGTTAVAAIEEGRRYIGIDIVEDFVNLAKGNCRKAQPSQTKLTEGVKPIL